MDQLWPAIPAAMLELGERERLRGEEPRERGLCVRGLRRDGLALASSNCPEQMTHGISFGKVSTPGSLLVLRDGKGQLGGFEPT